MISRTLGVCFVACALLATSRTSGAQQTVGADSLSRGGYKRRFNNDDQSHADLCVKLRVPRAELRYADGSLTGFALGPELLQPVTNNAVSCPQPGMARLDAREIVMSTDGRPMLFHRGGWGFAGNDQESAVHYGHVLIADLDTVGLRYLKADAFQGPPPPREQRWKPVPLEPWIDAGQRNGNGSACERRATEPKHVVVHSIPVDMKYLNTAGTAAVAYAIYGSPSEDLGTAADRSRGIKYTMLEWSWINVRGGGVARALVADGSPFYPCLDVPPIRLASVADPKNVTAITGWVDAAYGAVPAGQGTWLFGWLVTAHKHGNEATVSHLR